MSMRVTLAVLLSVAWLGGCAGDRSDPHDVASNARDCAAIATTGDMYGYCMEVGPQRALGPDDAPLPSTADIEASRVTCAAYFAWESCFSVKT
jgi:hypothetical protein